jgi:hypothetical protein
MYKSKMNKTKVIEAMKKGEIDIADISFPNLVDDIIEEMMNLDLISPLEEELEDKRKNNAFLPFSVLLTLSIAAKMKIKTSLTDIPFAITDAELLSKLGWNLWDPAGLKNGLMSEGTLRNLIKKYSVEEFFEFYCTYYRKQVAPRLGISCNIHILDCTEIEVAYENDNYEGAGIVKKGETKRGYKMATLRGITGDSGVIEDLEWGQIQMHDLNLSKRIITQSEVLKENDVIIQDRGFISREMINYLKCVRGVDVYIPVKKEMNIYTEAVAIAKAEGNWKPHPNKKRKTQQIQPVTALGNCWEEGERKHIPEDVQMNNVPLQACVVWEKREDSSDNYYVFITTDTSKTAKQIIQMYELRSEIEEDFRQMKEFWKLEDFQSTKLPFISFHIVMLLFGYLFFQIFKMTGEGVKFAGKSLPVVLKNYIVSKQKKVMVYAQTWFGIFSVLEFADIYADCSNTIRERLRPVIRLM